MIVLPALGGETIRPRAPLPIGEIRSSTRATISSGARLHHELLGGVRGGEVLEVGAPGDRHRVGALELVDAREDPLHVADGGLPLHEEPGLKVHAVDEPARDLDVERLRRGSCASRSRRYAVPLALELEDALDLLGHLGLRLPAGLGLRGRGRRRAAAAAPRPAVRPARSCWRLLAELRLTRVRGGRGAGAGAGAPGRVRGRALRAAAVAGLLGGRLRRVELREPARGRGAGSARCRSCCRLLRPGWTGPSRGASVIDLGGPVAARRSSVPAAALPRRVAGAPRVHRAAPEIASPASVRPGVVASPPRNRTSLAEGRQPLHSKKDPRAKAEVRPGRGPRPPRSARRSRAPTAPTRAGSSGSASTGPSSESSASGAELRDRARPAYEGRRRCRPPRRSPRPSSARSRCPSARRTSTTVAARRGRRGRGRARSRRRASRADRRVRVPAPAGRSRRVRRRAARPLGGRRRPSATAVDEQPVERGRPAARPLRAPPRSTAWRGSGSSAVSPRAADSRRDRELLEQAGEVGLEREDADRAGQRGRLRHDRVGARPRPGSRRSRPRRPSRR